MLVHRIAGGNIFGARWEKNDTPLSWVRFCCCCGPLLPHPHTRTATTIHNNTLWTVKEIIYIHTSLHPTTIACVLVDDIARRTLSSLRLPSIGCCGGTGTSPHAAVPSAAVAAGDLSATWSLSSYGSSGQWDLSPGQRRMKDGLLVRRRRRSPPGTLMALYGFISTDCPALPRPPA